MVDKHTIVRIGKRNGFRAIVNAGFLAVSAALLAADALKSGLDLLTNKEYSQVIKDRVSSIREEHAREELDDYAFAQALLEIAREVAEKAKEDVQARRQESQELTL